MMIPERPSLERRVLAALDGSGGPSRIPVILGGCGSGRTSLLLRLRDLIGRTSSQYVDIERVATTPERFLAAIRETSPFVPHAQGDTAAAESDARGSFDAVLELLDRARPAGGGPATFLLDEFFELRTFESFPGLRSVLRDLVAALASSGNRFVLTSRYAARAHRLLRDAPARFDIIEVAPLSAAEIRSTMGNGAEHLADGYGDHDEDRAHDEVARLIQALSAGRPAYARLIAGTAAALSPRGGGDPVSAMTALLAPGGQLTSACRFTYELRLHRARGYGALKAILEVLAAEEPLTLTEIAVRLRRTPGSTKDYLSWLEDVDLIASRQKRYSFTDPVLRLWVRLHCRPAPPSEEDVAREVHAYVVGRLPHAERAPAVAAGTAPDTEHEKKWGISVEID